jgi:WD40 repeat protein
MIRLQGHRMPVRALAFSPDGRFLAVGGPPRRVVVWDVASAAVATELENLGGGTVVGVRFTPDGDRVAVAYAEGGLNLYDWPDGGLLAETDTDGRAIASADLSPDGKALLTATADLQLWRVDDFLRRAWELPRSDGYYKAAAFAPDGRAFAVSVTLSVPGPNKVGVDVRDATTRKRRHLSSGLRGTEATRLAWSADGSAIAALAGRRLFSLDAKTGGLMATQMTGNRRWFTDLAAHPTAPLFAVGGNDGAVRYYEPASLRERASFELGTSEVRSLTFAPDGLRAAAGGKTGEVVVWDVDV